MKTTQDRRTRLHRALDCVLDRRAAKDAAEWNPEIKSYSDPSKCPVCSGKGFTMGKKVSKYAGQPPISKCPTCKGTGKIAAKDTADFPAEYKDCKRCGKKTDVLEIFPGGVCLGCWEKKEGKAPLTEADFKGMVRAFKNPLKKRAKDWDPAFAIKIAADDIAKLRKVDVYRVLESAGTAHEKPLASYIKKHRPDLAAEVDSCIEDLQGA